MQADKYLSPEGKEAYAQYKQEQAEKAMQKEQAKLERGVTNQELDRETGTVAEGEPKAPETGKTDIEQLNKRLSEMSAVVKICGALDRKDVVGWNEKTQAVTIADDERALEGKEVYDFLFAEAADYVMMQTISGETEKALEMDGLLKDARQYASRYEGEPSIEQTEEQPLTADDVQNLVLIDREYIRGTRTTVYDFECDIRGEHDKLQYTLEYHDDGEGFTIHTEKNDIWERMPEPELARLNFKGLMIDEVQRVIIQENQEIELTYTEFEILKLLAKHPGIVFSKEQIYDIVWKESYSGDYNIVMSHVRNIREKIEDNPSKPIYIQTVWGVGYRFNKNLIA